MGEWKLLEAVIGRKAENGERPVLGRGFSGRQASLKLLQETSASLPLLFQATIPLLDDELSKILPSFIFLFTF